MGQLHHWLDGSLLGASNLTIHVLFPTNYHNDTDITMAPVRRYLRITKYSVLECRIYLDNPALAQSWLLNPRNPVLPRVIESVRPWVLPKLREERERSKKKSSAKKKGIKDTVIEGMVHSRRPRGPSANARYTDDFEVSIFLTETNTRHSILRKHKHFHDKAPPKMQSNTNRLIGETNDNPVDIDASDGITILQEEDPDDEGGALSDIPIAPKPRAHGAKRRRIDRGHDDEFEPSDNDETASAIEIDSEAEEPAPKRLREAQNSAADDKKKLAMDVSYEGFAIYGRVLCLVVRKRDSPSQRNAGKTASGATMAQPAGQASMENWITSTQIPVGEEVP